MCSTEIELAAGADLARSCGPGKNYGFILVEPSEG